MDEAKEQIKRAYKDRAAKYGPIWATIDERWNNQLHRPIHSTGYFLNPLYHYKAKESGALRGGFKDGLVDCIDRMIPLESDQLEIHRQVTTFSNASGTFGKNLAKIAREADEPAHRWEAFGGHCPELQKFAIRILSQTCSATRYPDPPVLPTSVSSPARTLVAGTSSAQPRQKRSCISSLSQLAFAAQPASGTTSTVAVGDDEEEEEPWGLLSDPDDDPEIDRHDLGSSGSNY
eukprot:PITA_20683